MLSTPPAFVLSQDQTLNKWYLNSLRCSNLYRAICHSIILFIVAAFRRIDYSLLTHNFGSHLSKMRPAGAFRFVTLFNLQGTRRLAEHLVLYKIHSSLSRTFFKFFQTSSFHLLSYRCSPDSLVIIADHPAFVNTFFEIFRNFFKHFLFSRNYTLSRKDVLQYHQTISIHYICMIPPHTHKKE